MMRKKTSTALSFGVAMLTTLSALNSAHAEPGTIGTGANQLVECYGVAKTAPTDTKKAADVPLMMTKGMCDKLPFTKQVPVSITDYVHCYGVAAAGKNDCASKISSCGGTSKVAKEKDTWTSLPSGVCASLEGSSLTPGK